MFVIKIKNRRGFVYSFVCKVLRLLRVHSRVLNLCLFDPKFGLRARVVSECDEGNVLDGDVPSRKVSYMSTCSFSWF